MSIKIHTCSHKCTRPACVLQQRDELLARIECAERDYADMRRIQGLLIAETRRANALLADAQRYRWLRAEADEPHFPLAAVVWKRNGDRNESEWVNAINGDDLTRMIDAALDANEAK